MLISPKLKVERGLLRCARRCMLVQFIITNVLPKKTPPYNKYRLNLKVQCHFTSSVSFKTACFVFLIKCSNLFWEGWHRGRNSYKGSSGTQTAVWCPFLADLLPPTISIAKMLFCSRDTGKTYPWRETSIILVRGVTTFMVLSYLLLGSLYKELNSVRLHLEKHGL